jgi:squalene synthase HpnC
MRRSRLDHAYARCLDDARSHYENFPVASWLLPVALRGPVAAIYAFARRGDDLADEGGMGREYRLGALREMDAALDALVAGEETDDYVYTALGDAITRHDLDVQLLRDLLLAFREDVTKGRYANFGEVMHYCRYSANPIGRLLLQLIDRADDTRIGQADAICTALQLINFYQDLYSDYIERGRIYLPRDEMLAHGVEERHIRDKISDAAMRALMRAQYERADRLLRAGAPLGADLPGRFGMEIRAIVTGGARVLYHLRRQSDLFARPRLNRADAWHIALGALLPRRRKA